MFAALRHMSIRQHASPIHWSFQYCARCVHGLEKERKGKYWFFILSLCLKALWVQCTRAAHRTPLRRSQPLPLPLPHIHPSLLEQRASTPAREPPASTWLAGRNQGAPSTRWILVAVASKSWVKKKNYQTCIEWNWSSGQTGHSTLLCFPPVTPDDSERSDLVSWIRCISVRNVQPTVDLGLLKQSCE